MSRAHLLLSLAALCYAVVTFTLGPYPELVERLGDTPLFDEQPAASVEQINATLSALGVEGRALYRAQLVWDGGFLLANAVLLFCLLRAALPKSRKSRTACVALAALPALLDVLENCAIWHFLDHWRAPHPAWVEVASAVTPMKFATFGLALLVLLLAVGSRCIAICRVARQSALSQQGSAAQE